MKARVGLGRALWSPRPCAIRLKLQLESSNLCYYSEDKNTCQHKNYLTEDKLCEVIEVKVW